MTKGRKITHNAKRASIHPSIVIDNVLVSFLFCPHVDKIR
jgi:hypothetical protein